MSGRTEHRLSTVIGSFAIRRSMPSNPLLIANMLRCSTWYPTHTAYGPSARAYLEKIRADEKLTRLLSAGRWKGKYDAMVKAVESGEAEELIPFEEAKKKH